MLAALNAERVRVLAYADSRIFSGAESFFCRLVADLSASSTLAVTCAAPSTNEELVAALAEASRSHTRPLDVPDQPLRLAALHLYDARRREAVRRLADRAQWDVLLMNLPTAEYGSTPLASGLSTCSKTMGVLHIHQRFSEFGFRLGRMRERLAQRVLRRVDFLCFTSPSAEPTVRRFWAGERTRIRFVQSPAPRVGRVSREAARRQLRLAEGPLVGMAGRITMKHKGHDLLVEAAAHLVRTQPNVRFAVAGAGSDEGALREMLAARGLDSRFSFLGPVKPIDDFLAAVDVLAMPSRFEAMPLVALEAIQCGTPGVATSVDGLRELWPREWQVPADDPAAFAAALSSLLTEDAASLRRVVATARERMGAYVTDDLGGVFEPLIVDLAMKSAAGIRDADVPGRRAARVSHGS